MDFHHDLGNYCLSILIGIRETFFVPVSELFYFVVQNEVKFITFEKALNVQPEKLVIYFVRFNLLLDLLKDLDVGINFIRVITLDELFVSFLKLIRFFCLDKSINRIVKTSFQILELGKFQFFFWL